MNQAMGQGGMGDMINCEIKLKGDPFWLGPAYPMNTKVIDRLSLESNATDDQLKIGTLMPIVLMRVLTPDEADINIGTVSNTKRSNETISGMYYINKINHTFSAGKFEQTINGHRELKTTVDRVNSLIDHAKPRTAEDK
jgi:hypothetical protein